MYFEMRRSIVIYESLLMKRTEKKTFHQIANIKNRRHFLERTGVHKSRKVNVRIFTRYYNSLVIIEPNFDQIVKEPIAPIQHENSMASESYFWDMNIKKYQFRITVSPVEQKDTLQNIFIYTQRYLMSFSDKTQTIQKVSDLVICKELQNLIFIRLRI